MTATFAAPARAFARAISDRFADCLREDASARIDVALARRQHAAYVRALERAGTAVEIVPEDPEAPDCCFIEDAAVLWEGGGVITRMKPPSRARESAAVASALAARGLVLPALAPPATLDGGDVMRAGGVLLVGRSDRTNDAGVAALAGHAARAGLEVVSIRVAAGLHVKSAVTMLDATAALIHGNAVDRASLSCLGLQLIEAPDPQGANVLPLGERVLVSAAAPATAAALRARGHDVELIDVSELHKADGALTCLSLRLPHPGSWCA